MGDIKTIVAAPTHVSTDSEEVAKLKALPKFTPLIPSSLNRTLFSSPEYVLLAPVFHNRYRSLYLHVYLSIYLSIYNYIYVCV